MTIFTPKSYKMLKYCPAQYKYEYVDKLKIAYIPTISHFKHVVILNAIEYLITQVNNGYPMFADKAFYRAMDEERVRNSNLDLTSLNLNEFYLLYQSVIEALNALHFWGKDKSLIKFKLGSFNNPIEVTNNIGLVGIPELLTKNVNEINILDLYLKGDCYFDSEISYLYALMLKLSRGSGWHYNVKEVIMKERKIRTYSFNSYWESYIINRLKLFKSMVDNKEFEARPSEGICFLCKYRGLCDFAYKSEDDKHQIKMF